MKLSVIALATLLLLCACEAGNAFGQPSTIQSLGHLTANYRLSIGRRVSDDGTVIVGGSSWTNNRMHGFRWSVEGGMQHLAPHPLDDRGDAYGVSGDGNVTVGYTAGGYLRYGAAIRWNADGQLEDVYGSSELKYAMGFGVSGDGLVAVGYGSTGDYIPTRAFRFTTDTSPYELGTVNAYGGGSYAYDASRDGSVIVGSSDVAYPEVQGAFRWTPAEGMRGLGTLYRDSIARAVSDDGEVIVGSCYPSRDERAFRWTEADLIQELFGVEKFVGKTCASDVSGDGAIIVGRCEMPPNRSFSDRGTACVWRNGEARSLWDLLEHEYPADLEGWSALNSVEGISADGTTLTGHGLYRGDQTAFRVVLRNSAPTVAPIAPLTVECEGDSNLVELQTVVGDSGTRVTVRWKVDGETVQEQKDVAPGATTFQYDFPHGESSVVVEATDGEYTTTAGTTVTVSDTTAPTLIVAPDVIVPTDTRKDFATNVTLKPPQVYDACDGDPELIHDAPALFPVGVTTVHWTATDADGNRSTATQRVIVEDREPPVMTAAPNVETYCDRGRIFATLRLTPPGAVDNVTSEVAVKGDAGARFRIGRTRVTWTATDEAGNASTKSMIVNVLNRKPRARPGKTVRFQAESESGVDVRLDGSASSDPDGHALRYFWRAPRVVFRNPKVAKPLATFPIGVTNATLTVTDEAGGKSSARVRVIVTLANSEERPRGAQANAAFDAAAASARRAAESGSAGEACLAGLAHSAAAQRLSIQAGERIRWEEGGTPNDAKFEYAALRAEQRQHGERAAQAWLRAYAETGDDAALAAAIDALRGAAYAQADLAER